MQADSHAPNPSTPVENGSYGTPLWVWLIIAAIAAIEPVLHVWIHYGAPAGAEPTGLHMPDSAYFVHSMDMFNNGFYLPYATCQSEFGDRYIGYFAATGYWLYGFVGFLGTNFGIDRFVWLGIANGFFGFIYLLTAWRFLQTVVPNAARLAFLLFAIGGGPGGFLFLATYALGLQNNPGFESWFYPFAMYELFEGPNLSPALHMTRLYYTVPLALGIGGLTALIKGAIIGCPRHVGFSAFLIFCCTVLHIRNGVFLAVVALLFLWQFSRASRAFRIRSAVAWIAATGLGASIYMLVITQHPTVTQNTFDAVQQAAWFVPLAIAAMFFLIPAAVFVRSIVPSLGRWEHAAVFAAMGYLAAFTIGFVGYQLIMGNTPMRGNAAAAVAVSDFALIGAVAGGVFSWRTWREPKETNPLAFVAMWLLLFTCGTIAAFGQGWYLQFAPQRLMVVLGLPLSIAAALGLKALSQSRPILARVHIDAAVAFGVVSLVAGALFVQGPFAHRPGEGPFATFRLFWMTDNDARLAPEGSGGMPVLAAPPFGDVVAARGIPNGNVVFGLPSSQGDQLFAPLEADVRRFFSHGAEAEFRAAFLEKYCVTWIHVSETFPVAPKVVDELDDWHRLRLQFVRGGARSWIVLQGGS